MATNNGNDTWSSNASSSGSGKKKMNVNVYNFQVRMRKVLTKEERNEVTHILSCYHKNRNVYYLTQSLKSVLDNEEKRSIIPLLKQIIPVVDRAAFDQFTCEGTYVRRSGSSRESSVSLQQTDDSGIGITTCGNSQSNDLKSNLENRPVRSASMSEISGKSSKLFSSGTFGSAVRRRVKAVLSRRASTSSLKASDRRRHYSETHLSETGKEGSSLFGSFIKKSSMRKKKSSNIDVSSTSHQSDVVLIKLNRLKSTKRGLGFIIGGGSELGTGIFVSHVEEGSAADEANLKPGDLIIQANDTALHSAVSHDVAVQILKNCDKLVLHVKPQGAKHIMRNKPHPRTRPPSPPVFTQDHTSGKVDTAKSGLRLLSSGQRRINLNVKEGQNLGLMIRGGSEYGLGIFVTAVDESSAAENSGLKAGDEILEVNNVSLDGLSHADAVKLIRSSRMLIMTVRYVGRIPQSANTSHHQPIDDRVSLHSSIGGGKVVGKLQPNGVRGAFQRKITSPHQQMILPNMLKRSTGGDSKLPMKLSSLNNSLSCNPVWGTLSEEEQKSLKYYVKEYLSSHVSPDALVLALSQLLADHEKFSLMSVIRDYISHRDLDRFDVLVLRREVEALRSRHQEDTTNSNESISTNETSNKVLQPPKLQSTPNSSFQSSESNTESAEMISPVRLPDQKKEPKVKIPPVPPKAPPNKPRRSFRERKIFNTTSSFEYEEPNPPSEKKESTKVTIKTSDRSISPFSLALEKHRSSNSGRIKAGSHPIHPSLPCPQFFEPPVQFKNNEQNQNSISCHDSTTSDSDFPPPPLSFSSSASSTMSERSSHPPRITDSPSEIHLRPTSFSSFTRKPSPCARKYAVTAEVHSQSLPRTVNKQTDYSSSAFNGKKLNLSDDSSSEDESKYPYFLPNVETQKVVIFQTVGALGLTIAGGAGTKQPLPKVVKIQRGSCSHLCGRIKIGHVIHEVNGTPLRPLKHDQVIQSIARAFKEEGRDSLELIVSGPYLPM
ncbi:whirlin [Ciona intestinalis]